MKAKRRTRTETPSLLDAVALLTDISARDLTRGQVGTVVEQLDDKTALVEFSDGQGAGIRTCALSAKQTAGSPLCARGCLRSRCTKGSPRLDCLKIRATLEGSRCATIRRAAFGPSQAAGKSFQI